MNKSAATLVNVVAEQKWRTLKVCSTSQRSSAGSLRWAEPAPPPLAPFFSSSGLKFFTPIKSSLRSCVSNIRYYHPPHPVIQ